MTVQTTSNKAGPYTGNGVTVTWGTTFRVDEASDLQVILTDEIGVETTLNPAQYTVSGWGDPAGVTVTYPLSGAPLAPAQKITLLRLVDYDQQTSITNQGGFYPKVIESALDRIVYQCQQLAEKLGRAVTVNVSSTQDPSTVLASIATNAAAAAVSAANADTIWTTFHNQYLGSFAADPATDNSGNPLQQGALYWNTVTAKLRIFGGSGWQDTATAVATSLTPNSFSGTGSQTAFTLSTAPLSTSACLVYISGVAQRPGTDYTVTGATLTFITAPPAGSGNILAVVISALAVGTPSDGSVTPPKLDPTVPLAVGADVGQCYLSLSAGNLKLSPFNGNKIVIGGMLQAIPSSGVSLSAAGLAAGTNYFIYAYMNGATMMLEASTTGHTTDTNGIEIKIGDNTRTLVGLARPVAGPAWVDSDSQRFVISWFNRRNKAMVNAYLSTKVTASAVSAELSTESRIEFLCWGGSSIQAVTAGYFVSSAANSAGFGIGFDGASTWEQQATSGNNGWAQALSAPNTYSNVTEGYHYVTIMARALSGSITFAAGCRSTGMIHG